MDKFESLRAFTQVVNEGGFAAAARKLGLTRSAVNKLVIHLEDDLGVQLLHRTTRKVTPTDTGLAFYERCTRILADLEEAEVAVTHMHQEARGTLRVNAPMSFGTMHLAPAIADFLVQYPELHVELILSDRFIDPVEEGFDITLRIAASPQTTSLIAHRLAAAHRVLCAAPSYLAQYGTPTHPDQLKSHSCLHYGHLATDNHWKIIGSDGEYSIQVTGIICSNNGEVLKDAAIKGLGITLLPTFLAGPALQQGDLCVVLPDYQIPEISIYVLYPINRHLSAKIQLFAEFLKDRFGHNPQWDEGLDLT